MHKLHKYINTLQLNTIEITLILINSTFMVRKFRSKFVLKVTSEVFSWKAILNFAIISILWSLQTSLPNYVAKKGNFDPKCIKT